MNSKIGQVEESFHWVFVIIAGAVILMVFGVFIYQIKFSSDKERSAELLNDLNLILAGGDISTKTVNEIDNLPSAPLKFTCKDVSVGGAQIGFNGKIVFSPQEIQSTRLTLWSYDWNAPYYVMNFLFVASPEQRFVFVSDNSENSQKLKLLIEDVMPVAGGVQPKFFVRDFSGTLNEVVHKGHDKTKIILLNTDGGSGLLSPSFSGKDVTLMRIDANGKIYYLDLNKDVMEESNFIGTAGIFGAIFSNDKETFECVMDSAMRRLNLVTKMYIKRAELLRQSRGSVCPGYGLDSISRIETVSRKKYSELSEQDMITIQQSILGLDNQNVLMQQLSCPLIY